MPQSSLDDVTRIVNGNIAVSRDRIGWMSWGTTTGKPIGGRYTEIHLPDGLVRDYPLPQAEYLDGPCGLTNGGVAIVNAVTDQGIRPGHLRRCSLMRLDRAKSVWVPLSTPGQSSLADMRFVGVDGDTVALWDIKSKMVNFFSLK